MIRTRHPSAADLRAGARRRSACWASLLIGVAILLTSPVAVAPAIGQERPIQDRIDESKRRLEQIRAERERLRSEMSQLASQVHDESEEISNLERQIGASSSVVAELDLQLRAVLAQIDQSTKDMILTRDELTVRRAVLMERLRQIYRRGPLGTVQVLLGARSFTELINRYKYLYLVALQDRFVVRQVAELEERLSGQRASLADDLAGLRRLRGEKVGEIQELEQLENRRQRRLARMRSQESSAQGQLAELARDEERLLDLVVQLEVARREAERVAGVASASTLRTSDLGNLDWPVEGRVVYGFGPERNGNTTLSRDGIGIAAPPGTPVRTVEAGQVEFAGPWGLYGPSVIVSHGGGYYSLYLYLRDLAVRDGDTIDAGARIGSVGGTTSPEGPHIEFQILQPGSAGQPRPVDPVRWLRERS